MRTGKIFLHIKPYRMTRRVSSTNYTSSAALSVQEAIDNNPLSRKSIIELVPELYVGRNQLQAEFKQLTKLTIKRYRLIKRMEAAHDMLATGNVKVKEVAFQCGYKKQGNFTADFKSIYHQTPLEWLQYNINRSITGM
jgi:AraC-like DNA-binding protein